MKLRLQTTLFSLFALFSASLPIQSSLAAEPAAPSTQNDILVDKIVAVVDDRIILKSELTSSLLEKSQQLRQQGIPVQDNQALREQVLDSLILEAVQLSRAELLGLKISDQELNEQMEKIAAQNNMSLLALRNRLNLEQDDGFNKIRNKIKNQLLVQKLRQQEVISRVQITDSEINNYMKRMTLANKYREVHLQHILIALPQSASQQQRSDAQAKAESLRKRLLSGENFEQLAVRYSNGSRALNGGDMGWMQDNEVPTFFAKAVDKLQVGEVSGVIQSPSGFHLVKLTDERQTGTEKIDEYHFHRFLVLSDDAMDQEKAPESLIEVTQNIKSLDDFNNLSQTYADIPEDVNKNSDMGWRAQDELPPQVLDKLAMLTIGEALPPLATEKGWMIYYLDAVRSVNQNAEDKKQEAANAVRMRKANEMFDLWLRRLRDEAYVRIDLEN